MKIKTLEELYIHELQDLLSAETQLISALPKVADAVTSDELRTCIMEHLDQTKEHASRLRWILAELNQSDGGVTCMAMKGLLKEGEENIRDVEAGPVLDAAIIGSCQRVEHYEVAAYGTTKAFANVLGFKEHVRTLEKTEDEESQADLRLTDIAVGSVNKSADQVMPRMPAG